MITRWKELTSYWQFLFQICVRNRAFPSKKPPKQFFSNPNFLEKKESSQFKNEKQNKKKLKEKPNMEKLQVILLPVQLPVSTGKIPFDCVLHSQTLSSLQTKQLYCGSEDLRTVYSVTYLKKGKTSCLHWILILGSDCSYSKTQWFSYQWDRQTSWVKCTQTVETLRGKTIWKHEITDFQESANNCKWRLSKSGMHGGLYPRTPSFTLPMQHLAYLWVNKV